MLTGRGVSIGQTIRTWRVRHRRRVEAVAMAVLPALGWLWLVAPAERWPGQDGPHVLGIAGRLALLLREGAFMEFAWSLGLLLAPHPPGAYLPATAAYAVAGLGPGVHLWAAALGLAVCCDGLRRLGAGPVGLLWLAGMPLVWQQLENYGVDFLAAACVVQSVSHLAASQRLSRGGAAAAWGAWMGAAFMVKYTAPVFLVGPCLVAGVWTLRHRRWRGLLAGVVGFSLIALSWWVPKLPQVVAYLTHSSEAVEQFAYDTDVVTEAWGSWENLSFYPAVLLEGYGPAGLLALAVAAVLPGRQGTGWGTRIALLLGTGLGWLVLTDLIIREARYFMPGIVLLVALASTARLRWLWVLPAALGAWQAATTYASTEPVPPRRLYALDWESAGAAWPAVPEAFAPISDPPARWALDDAFEALRRYHGADTGTVGVLVHELGGGPELKTVLFASTLAGYRWHLASPSFAPGTDPVFVAPFASEAWPSRDFRVVLAFLGETSDEQRAWVQQQGLVLVEAWPLDNHFTGAVYVRPDRP